MAKILEFPVVSHGVENDRKRKKKVARIAVNIYFSEEWRSIGSIASRIWSSLRIAEIFSYFEKKWILVINYRDLHYRESNIYLKTNFHTNELIFQLHIINYQVNFQFISLFFSNDIYLRLIIKMIKRLIRLIYLLDQTNDRFLFMNLKTESIYYTIINFFERNKIIILF